MTFHNLTADGVMIDDVLTEAERWYWQRNLIEPNARGASEIRRVWWDAIGSRAG